jgi:BatD DUF11 like domain
VVNDCTVFIFANARSKTFNFSSIKTYLPFGGFLFSCLCLLIHTASAQVKFSATASLHEMGRADYVEIQFVIENAGQIENFQTPDFPDFSIIQGPNQSTGMSVVNGNMSQYQSINYLLQPKKPGKFMIKPAAAKVDGKLLHTNSLQITVLDKNSTGNSATPGFSPLPDPSWPTAQPDYEMEEVLRPGENVSEKIRKNFFLRTDVSKTECYLGEPIVVTYKLYARLRSDSRVSKHPSLNGFSVYDMVEPGQDHISTEKVNGKIFTVHTIRKAQLIPLQPGDVVLDPIELDNNVYLVKADGQSTRASRQGLGGLLDQLFHSEASGTPFNEHIVLESKPVTIHIKPLPEEGKPADFNGAVGKYTIQSNLDTKEIDTGDATTLSVVIKGTGNLTVINAPVIEWPEGMESYDVSNKENINKTVTPLGGTKTFSYSFICSKTGKFTIPPIKLSYFDLVSRSYKTVMSDPLELQVNHSIKKPSPKPVISQPSVKTTDSDRTNYLWLAVGILGIVIVVLVFVNQRKQFRTRELEKLKLAEAAEAKILKSQEILVDPLKDSRDYMFAGDHGKFYGSVNRAIWKAVSEKMNLPASELNKFNIESGLRAKGWNEENIDRLKNVLNECELKLYTPEFSTVDMLRILNSADEIILKLNS